MAIQGLRTNANWVTDQRPKNWREAILLLYPNGMAPLTGLTSLMSSNSTDDPEFNWWTKSLATQRMALSAAITAAATTLTVSSGAKGLKEGHLIRIEQTEEVVRVSADPTSDTSIPVVRGYSGTTATAIANVAAAGVNPNAHVIGSAYEEGSSAPTGINYDPTKVYNYTQIFRNTLEMTRTATKTRLRTGDQVKEAKRECLELHSIEMEKAFWFGKRVETTQNGKPIRTTNGVVAHIDSGNVVNQAGASTDMSTLEGWLKNAFSYGSSEKMGFCGNTAMLTIQRIIRKNSTFFIESGIKEYGMNVSRIVCPFGTLVLKTHPLFNQLTGGTTGGTAYYGPDSWLAILDMKEIKYRYFSGDDTRYEKDLTVNGTDGLKSGYLTEAGLEVHHPTSHYLIKGLATAAADS